MGNYYWDVALRNAHPQSKRYRLSDLLISQGYGYGYDIGTTTFHAAYTNISPEYDGTV